MTGIADIKVAVEAVAENFKPLEVKEKRLKQSIKDLTTQADIDVDIAEAMAEKRASTAKKLVCLLAGRNYSNE